MDRLSNTVRDYAWGSPTGIPEIIGRMPDGSPVAELWVGAYPSAPSQINGTGLDAWVARDPRTVLGAASAAAFGARLPFLLKLLSARTALSIQAHPGPEQAQSGFAREEAAGIPLDAPHRSYRDPWHKPELLHALGDFSMLCGFRPPHAVQATIDRLLTLAAPADRSLLSQWRSSLDGAEESALRTAMSMVLGNSAHYGPLADRLAALPVASAEPGDPSRIATPVDPFETLQEVNADFPGDAGALVALMLNRLHLSEGQSVAIEPGVPHAYLQGLAVEVMASSDNVIRGGLTHKHIDLVELDAVVRCTTSIPQLRAPDAHGVLRGPSEDFALQRIETADDVAIHRSGAAVLLCTAGQYRVRSGDEELMLRQGDSVFVGAHEPQPRVSGDGLLFAATTALGES